METIGKQKIWSFLDRSGDCRIATNTAIRQGPGHKVGSYLELARKIAELQFRNRDHVLLFRGQDGDPRNARGNTSLKPSLFRAKAKGNPDRATLQARFETLARAEQALVAQYQSARFTGQERGVITCCAGRSCSTTRFVPRRCSMSRIRSVSRRRLRRSVAAILSISMCWACRI
jgi:hypothetical protein